MRQAGYRIEQECPFGEHHAFSQQDLDQLEANAQAEGLSLITTRKDWVRLPLDWQTKVEVADLQFEWPRSELMAQITSKLQLGS